MQAAEKMSVHSEQWFKYRAVFSTLLETIFAAPFVTDVYGICVG